MANRFDISIGAITTDLKKGLADARAELNKFKKDTESTDWKSVLNAEKVALAQSRTEAQAYRTEAAKLTLEKRKAQPAVEALAGSYREAQQRLTALGKTIRETQGGFTTNSTIVQKQVSEYNELNAKLKAFDASMGNNQRNVGNYAMGLGNANGVTMEFTRIIQDAPYGMIGIGNNIQQLTANWQQYAQASREASAAQGKTITTGGLLRGALSSLLSPASLLSLGVAAVTSAWTLYTMWAQKSAKATKEKKEETVKYIDTLSGLAKAQATGYTDSQKELTTLDQLYKATQNLTIPMQTRKEAADELIKQYPEQLKGLSQEEILAGKASNAYKELTKSITATALASASANRITENSQKQLSNYLEIIDKQNKANQLSKSIEKTRANFTTSALGAGVGASGASQSNVVARESEQLNKVRKEIVELGNANYKISKENELLQNNINAQLQQGADITGKVGGTLQGIRETTSDISKTTNGILRDSLNYYDAKLLDIQDKYDKIYATVKDDGLLRLAKENEEAEKLRVNVEKLLDTTKQLRGVSNVSISGSLTIPTALTGTASIPNSVQSNDEFSKRFTNMFGRATAGIIDSLIGDLAKLNDSTYDIEKKYNELRANASEEQIASLNKMEKLEKRINNGFTNMLQRLGSTFTNMGSGVLTSAVSTGISSGSFDDLKKLFSGDNKAMGYGALGSLIGGLVQGTTKKTSTVGQGIGGALAGAGTGAMVGSLLGPVGTIVGGAVGGLVGLIGGIFGSKKAKKEEELQRAQLEEQKKQTALMERQALLAYTSSVIGQMTNQGVVTAVDRDAFGNLVANIKGSEIQLVLDRSKNSRGN